MSTSNPTSASSPSGSRPSRSSSSSSGLSPAEETRAAIDVMFEALSHIQASMETSSEEARREAYGNFKAALYQRLEQAVEDRSSGSGAAPAPTGASLETRGDGAPDAADVSLRQANADEEPGSPAGRETGDPRESDGGEEDTLEKFWPNISVDS